VSTVKFNRGHPIAQLALQYNTTRRHLCTGTYRARRLLNILVGKIEKYLKYPFDGDGDMQRERQRRAYATLADTTR